MLECELCGNTESFTRFDSVLVPTIVDGNDEEVSYEIDWDSSEPQGYECLDCGSPNVEWSESYGMSDYQEREEERRQMGLSDY